MQAGLNKKPACFFMKRLITEFAKITLTVG